MTKREAKALIPALSTSTVEADSHGWTLRAKSGLALDTGAASGLAAAEWAGTLAKRALRAEVMRALAR